MITGLSRKEELRRKTLSDSARAVIMKALPIESEDETCVMLEHDDFYLQIAFSPLHPLMVFYLARSLDKPGTKKELLSLNDFNLKSVLGSHAINNEVGCYSFRAAHWLETELTEKRFFEILGRCIEEAQRAYFQLTAARQPQSNGGT